MKVASLIGLGLAISLGITAYLMPSSGRLSKSHDLSAEQKALAIPGRWIDGENLRSADEVSATHAELIRHASMLAKKNKTSPGVATDRALLALLDNKPDAAATTLREALKLNPGDATLLNNIAVVELAKAIHGDSQNLVNALDAIEQCLDIQPWLMEAIFNRALILERFSLIASARNAWTDYINRELDESWRESVRERIANSSEGLSAEEKWREASALLQQAADNGYDRQVTELVVQFRQQSRILVQEEVLVRWAHSRASGNRVMAAKELAIAQRISQALVHVNGEASANDAVMEIESAEKRGLAADLAKGYILFKQGLEKYQTLQPQQALNLLSEAKDIFETTGCRSLSLWTEFWLGGSEYYLGDRQTAKEKIEELLATPETSRYPALRGRALWSRGLIMLVSSDFSSSLASYREALQKFEELGELENSGAVQALIAENLHLLGEEDQAWKSRVLALDRLKSFPSSVRLHNLLSETADQLVTTGLPSVAQYFQSEDLRVARRIGNPATIAEALLMRGRTFFALGHANDAWADMRDARQSIASIADISTREKLEAEAGLAGGELVDLTSAPQILDDLAGAVSYYKRAGIPPLAALAHLMRSRALLLLDHDAEAVSDLKAAIDVHEAAVDALDGIEAKSSYRNQWQPVFDQIIELEAIQRKNPWEALDFLEYARSGQWRANIYAAVAPKLRDGDVLVEYVLLSKNLLIWIMTSEGLQFTSEEISKERLEVLVSRFLSSLEKPKGDAAALSKLLSRTLVSPVVSRVTGARRWFLVSDRALDRIPFAALLDSVSGRYFIEERSLTYEPSSGSVIASKEDGARGDGASIALGPILAIGNPTADPRLYPGVAALPGAESEARGVAALYRQSSVFVGAIASRTNFLRSIKAAKIVHFAGHAFFSEEDPYSSSIIFASGGSRINSEISARELARMDLKFVDLFVVSACDIAPKGVGNRSGSSGIADALLDAGVGGVVATRWAVRDGESKDLLVTMHRKLLEGKSTAEALREAQIEELRRGMPLRLWAAFNLFGGG